MCGARGKIAIFMTDLRAKFRAAPVTTVIAGLCIVVFAAEYLLMEAGRDGVLGWFALSGAGLARGQWWTLVTYLFLHANLMHLVVNVLGLWFIGPEVEAMLGRSRYIVLYLVSGVAGGILQTAFSAPASELVGASGALCGVLLSFTTTYPQMQLRALLFFILPVNMKARTLGWGLIAFSTACAVLHLFPVLGHLAHLGGALAGAALTKYWIRRNPPMPVSPGQVPSTDELLGRVADEGLESLSGEERRRLEELGKTRGRRRW